MKRKIEDGNFENIKREKSNPAPMQGIGGDHPGWDIIIRKLDYESQMKISQQNQRLADIVKINAESELRKFKRHIIYMAHIREDKYM